MATTKSTAVAASFLCLIFGSAALAGDISCIGVVHASATARLMQLPEDQRQEHGAVLQFLQKTAAEAQREMVAAEQAISQDRQELGRMNPGASKEEIERLWREQVIQQGNADRNLAQEVATQSKLHGEEAAMIAASSQIVTDADRAQMQGIADQYISENAAQLAAIGSSPSLQRLISVMAASNVAADGRDLPAQSIASIGIDDKETDPTLVVAGHLVRATIAATAVGQRGDLRLHHLMNEGMRDTQFRSNVVGSGGQTAREVRKVVARGLNDGLVRHVVQRKIARIEPPSPPASATRDASSPKQKFVRAAEKVAASVTVIYKWVAPGIVEAAPKKVPAK